MGYFEQHKFAIPTRVDKIHYFIHSWNIAFNWTSFFNSDNRSNVEIQFGCSIYLRVKIFIRIIFQVHCLLTKRFRAMVKMVNQSVFSHSNNVLNSRTMVILFRCWWQRRPLESCVLRRGLASIQCSEILSHWHWCILGCVWTNFWQVISIFSDHWSCYSSIFHHYNINWFWFFDILDPSMGKWKWLVYRTATNQLNGKQLRAFLCIQVRNFPRKLSTPNFKHN